MYYTKKPVTIKAKVFNGELDGYNEKGSGAYNMVDWLDNHNSCHKAVIQENEGRVRFILATLEGDMLVQKGDYVIIGVANEVYPCKPEIFEASYTYTPEKL